MDLEIELKGAEALIQLLGELEAARWLEQPMWQSVFLLQSYMAKYPDQPAPRNGNLPYIRTGTLGRRWTTDVVVNPGSVVGEVGNNTTYGPWVQSSRFQAWMHKGIWQTDEEAIRDNQEQIQDFFDHAINNVLKSA